MDKPRIRILTRTGFKIIFITYEGDCQSITGWARKLKLDRRKIMDRLLAGRPIEEVLEPKRTWKDGVTPEQKLFEAILNDRVFTGDQYLKMYGVPDRDWGSNDDDEET